MSIYCCSPKSAMRAKDPQIVMIAAESVDDLANIVGLAGCASSIVAMRQEGQEHG